MNSALHKKIKSQPCLACGNSKVDPAHIRSRGAGGPDEEFNLLPLCFKDHRLQHDRGWKAFIAKYPHVGAELIARGWHGFEYEGVFRLVHPKLEKTQ
jgi:hypothetical protein